MKKLTGAFMAIYSSVASAGGFIAGTEITIGDQVRPVESFSKGDEIGVCRDEDGETFCGRSAVTKTYKETKQSYLISFSNGTDLTAAFDQMILLESGYMNTSELVLGDVAVTADDELVSVDYIEDVGVQETHTFTVLFFHNYIANGIQVHNVYGLGNGPYGQSNMTRRMADAKPSIDTRGYGGACARGAAGGAAGGFVRGVTTSPTPAGIGAHTAGGAAAGCATGMAHHSYDRNFGGNSSNRSSGGKN